MARNLFGVLFGLLIPVTLFFLGNLNKSRDGSELGLLGYILVEILDGIMIALVLTVLLIIFGGIAVILHQIGTDVYDIVQRGLNERR